MTLSLYMVRSNVSVLELSNRRGFVGCQVPIFTTPVLDDLQMTRPSVATSVLQRKIMLLAVPICRYGPRAIVNVGGGVVFPSSLRSKRRSVLLVVGEAVPN